MDVDLCIGNGNPEPHVEYYMPWIEILVAVTLLDDDASTEACLSAVWYSSAPQACIMEYVEPCLCVMKDEHHDLSGGIHNGLQSHQYR
jgi:hypothetical protein